MDKLSLSMSLFALQATQLDPHLSPRSISSALGRKTQREVTFLIKSQKWHTFTNSKPLTWNMDFYSETN